jgi:hypothetical protein
VDLDAWQPAWRRGFEKRLARHGPMRLDQIDRAMLPRPANADLLAAYRARPPAVATELLGPGARRPIDMLLALWPLTPPEQRDAFRRYIATAPEPSAPASHALQNAVARDGVLRSLAALYEAAIGRKAKHSADGYLTEVPEPPSADALIAMLAQLGVAKPAKAVKAAKAARQHASMQKAPK